jgi:hypothetical protein
METTVKKFHQAHAAIFVSEWLRVEQTQAMYIVYMYVHVYLSSVGILTFIMW